MAGGPAAAGPAPLEAAAQDGGALCDPLDVTLVGPLLPGAVISAAVDCPLVRADRTYTGAISTGPAAFPEAYPLEDGAVGFAGILLPDTFETEAHHRVVLLEAGGGVLGTAHLWVNAAGEHHLVEPPPPPAGVDAGGWRQALRHTGLVDGRRDGLVKLAALALAGAALVVRWRRPSPSAVDPLR
ncbi:MAG TPA: hypothetical protein VK007_01810 [Acidimicrobiales bacterium]|nr:hypothetical protein [Acidimicrobiales bacterium]